MLVALVRQIMATHKLRVSRDLMIAIILKMGKSSVERGRKANTCHSYLALQLLRVAS